LQALLLLLVGTWRPKVCSLCDCFVIVLFVTLANFSYSGCGVRKNEMRKHRVVQQAVESKQLDREQALPHTKISGIYFQQKEQETCLNSTQPIIVPFTLLHCTKHTQSNRMSYFKTSSLLARIQE
jgi:hypothetical protein